MKKKIAKIAACLAALRTRTNILTDLPSAFRSSLLQPSILLNFSLQSQPLSLTQAKKDDSVMVVKISVVPSRKVAAFLAPNYAHIHKVIKTSSYVTPLRVPIKTSQKGSTKLIRNGKVLHLPYDSRGISNPFQYYQRLREAERKYISYRS